MNEITPQKTPPPIEITEDIQVSLNRLGRDLETHAESGIRIGKELIHLKEITPHGKFGALVEWAYGLKEDTRQNYIRVAKKFGQNPNQFGFSHTVLIELSRPSVPESAREAAAKEESLTVKQSRELSAAHKRIQELESPRKPDLDNLIPGLMKKYKGASITIGTANRLSCLNEDQQKTFLSLLETKQFEENQNRKLAEEKLKALENLAKATRERDEIKSQLEKVSESDTASILLEKERELKRIKEEHVHKLFEQRKKAEKEASEFHEQRFKEQIKEAEMAKIKAERKAKEERERASAAWAKYQEHEREIKELKKQLEVDNPSNIDAAREQQVRSVAEGFLSSLRNVQTDMDKIGGGMELSIETAENAIQKAQEILNSLQTYQTSIINV